MEKTEEEARCILAVHWYSSSMQLTLSPRLHLLRECLVLPKPLGSFEVYLVVLFFQNTPLSKDARVLISQKERESKSTPAINTNFYPGSWYLGSPQLETLLLFDSHPNEWFILLVSVLRALFSFHLSHSSHR